MEHSQDNHLQSLQTILETKGLQEVLSIPGILTKIQLDMKTFVQHCIAHPVFTQRLIDIGLKCPIHQNISLQIKSSTHIAAEILTSDNPKIAELFILSSLTNQTSSLDKKGEEQTQAEESAPLQLPTTQKYIFLMSLFDYLQSQVLDQNCVNYIASTMVTLVRRKPSLFLEFFVDSPQSLQRLVEISHYPSVAHLMAKMVVDDEDCLTDKAISVKQRIIPMLLDKIHSKLGEKNTLEVLQGLEDILRATRTSNVNETTLLQKMSNQLVSHKEVSFFLSAFFEALQSQQKCQRLFNTLLNSAAYLTLILTRIGMDQKHENHDYAFHSEPQKFQPTLIYQLDQIFLQFWRITIIFNRVWEFKEIVGSFFGNIAINIIQPLSLLTRHSLFALFYSKIAKEERSQAIQALTKSLCTIKMSGILLQIISTIIQNMLSQEESLASTEDQVVRPDELYNIVKEYVKAFGDSISGLLQDSRNKNNKNQKSVFFFKILLLFQNYFKSTQILKRYPQSLRFEQLFPTFNRQRSILCVENTVVMDHPEEEKGQVAEELKFIKKSKILLQEAAGTSKEGSNQKQNDFKQKEEKIGKMTLMMSSKFNERKARVKLNKLLKEGNSPPYLTEPSVGSLHCLPDQTNSPPSKDNS